MHIRLGLGLTILGLSLLVSHVALGQPESLHQPSKQLPHYLFVSATPRYASQSNDSTIFPVDINSATLEELLQVGLSETEALRLARNRPYTTTEELVGRKILAESTYNSLKGLLFLQDPAGTHERQPGPSSSLQLAAQRPVLASFPPLDVNVASKEELSQIFERSEVEKIQSKRPYKDTKDLVAKEIISLATYENTKNLITAVYRPSEFSTMTFFVGAEYTLEDRAGQKNFAKPFPFFALRANFVHDYRSEYEKLQNHFVSSGKFRTQYDFRLVSTAVEKFDPSNPSQTTLSAERSFDANVTLAWMPFITDRNPAYRGSSVFEIGPMVKIGGQTTETGQNFFWRTAVGIRVMETGQILNGTYLDFGYGYSGNFLQPKYRFKVEGFVPLYDLGVPLFLQTTMETDFGDKPDLVKIAFGSFFDTSTILGKLKGLLGP
jgi:DNA uptake protein ComE-like DNA-binding protein